MILYSMIKIYSLSYWLYFYINMMYFILLIIMMFISVAFFTLFERKLLSYIHKRKGPNKALFLGLMQPFADAMKLLTKEFMYSNKTIYSVFIISPMTMLLITMSLWLLFPSNLNVMSINNSMLLILCYLSMSVYPIMLSGWSSNSSYALMGALRGLAQTISYEVSLAAIIISPMMLCETMNFYYFKDFQTFLNFGLWYWPSMIMIYISSLAEVNRTPFDFIEGESELVSGFNIEYYSLGFTLIFLSEYSMIIWMSGFISMMFFPSITFIFMTLCISYSMIWVRASFPRMRYDKLMFLCWKIILPCSITLLSFSLMIKYLILMNMYSMNIFMFIC
uniref:NADH-ubiquinone oxidoreductase chain 1 n=1 Tax=Agenioideus sp. SJW-2017 TaxID=1940100 RepID=A0A1P8VH92_9HYME|nr:NADH dehydrogenase subunit 1 [Agenioideus sp. SJW-2017]